METEGTEPLSLASLAQWDESEIIQRMPHWLGEFADGDSALRTKIVGGVTAAMEASSEEQMNGVIHALLSSRKNFQYYPAHPAARSVLRAFVGGLSLDSELLGGRHLAEAHAEGPVLVLCNHLAYCDTQLTDLLLAQNGFEHLANNLIAVAGPKVYDTLFRRMASLGMGTIKTAQSSQLVHNETGMSPRQVAEVAIQTVRTAQECMLQGGIVILYAEGSRSRSGRLAPFLKAVRRYVRMDGLRIVPMALGGTQRMMPIGSTVMRQASVRLQVGAPIVVADHGPMGAIQEAWSRIASMALPDNQPEPTTPSIA